MPLDLNYPEPASSAPKARTASLLLTALAALAGSVAPAQTPPATAAQPTEDLVVLNPFVVSTVRASLITAQEMKQNAIESVDSIVAQDIGKFPDITVADALQRVPGIQVSRAAGEANTVVIRGLPNLETTLNGYEVYTGTGRGVALQDIPAELIAGLDAYKSVGPDKLEGGVAGLIDVRLHRPFDFAGQTSSLSFRTSYADQAKKWGFNVSALESIRWENSMGEFGALMSLSYSKRKFQDQVIDNYVHFGAGFDVATDSSGTSGYFADNFGWQIRPGERSRPAATLSLQWKTKSGIEFYSDTLYTGYRNDYSVGFFIGIPSWGGTRSDVVLYPAGYGGYSIDDPLVAGTQDARFVKSFVAHDTVTLSSTQAYHDTTDTYQGAFGAKWDNKTVKINSEFSYNISTVKTKSVILDTGIISPSLAVTYNDGATPTVQASGIDYADQSNYFMTQFYDNWSRAKSDQYAFKTDVLVRLGNDLIPSLQFGARYSDRSVDFRAASPGGTFIWNAASASAYPEMGKVWDSKPFVSADQFNIRSFWAPDPAWLLNSTNTNTLRGIFGRAQGTPAAAFGSAFMDVERNFAVHALANYSAKLGELPLAGVVGIRMVNTRQKLGGYEHPILPDGSTNNDVWVRTSNTKSKWEPLPTVNGKINLTEQLLARFSVTKTMTRPDFSTLNPALSLYAPTMTVPANGSGGNPDLDPIKSTNYDASLEYYFSKTNQATVAVFYRTLDGYIQNYSSPETIGSLTYNVSRPRNTQGGYLEGAEVGYQHFLDFLPDAFKGLGFQTNYTYIKGETKNPATGITAPITQVSKHSCNIVLIYEKGPFSSRLAYNWRGKFIESFNQSGIQPTTVWVMPTKRLDFSASYAVNKNLTLTLDATNLLKSKYHDNFGNVKMFSRDVRNYDRTIELGLRYRY